MKKLPIASATCLLSLTFAVLGLVQTLAAIPRLAAQGRMDTVQLLDDAVGHLRSAANDLHAADSDKQGHKFKAESAVSSTLKEVEATLETLYPHRGLRSNEGGLAAEASAKQGSVTLFKDALEHLRTASVDIHKADTDKAGHKFKAEHDVNVAISEAEAVLKADFPTKR